MKNTKPTLTIMSGLPRSGKSTWILKNKKQSDIVISSDEIRSDIFGHVFHLNAESYVWSLVTSIVLILMKQQKNIIVDITGLNTKSRTQFHNMADKYNYKKRLVWLDTPYTTCVKRNKKTTNIPSTVLQSMRISFSYHYYKGCENFDEVFKISNNKKIKII